MVKTTTTPSENRTEAVQLIELAQALLTGADTEMAGLFLESAVETLAVAPVQQSARRSAGSVSLRLPWKE